MRFFYFLEGLNEMLANSTLTNCIDLEMAIQATDILTLALYIFVKTNFDCLSECDNLLYSAEVSNFHINKLWMKDVFSNTSTNSVALDVFSYTYISEQQFVETLFYDTSSVLGAAGGILSLALGFSCLSSLKAILSFVEKKLTK